MKSLVRQYETQKKIFGAPPRAPPGLCPGPPPLSITPVALRRPPLTRGVSISRLSQEMHPSKPYVCAVSLYF